MRRKTFNVIKSKWVKPLIVTVLIILFLYSFSLFIPVNIGSCLTVLAVIGLFIYKFGKDAMRREMKAFETWVGLELEEKKERLTEIEDKLHDLKDDEYDLIKDSDVAHSKKEFTEQLKKEQETLKERVERTEQNLPIPETPL